MIKKILLTLLSGAIISSAALAGDEWCAPASEKGVICDSCPEYNGSISGGYHSDYIWRGYQFTEENWTVDVNYTFGLGDALGLPFGDLTLGAWYLQGIPGLLSQNKTYEETNLYASLAGPTVLGFDTALNYTNYRVKGVDDTHELGLAISRELGGATLTYSASHDFDLNNWYHELSMTRSIPITDDLALELTSAAGYWDQSGAGQTGFAHRTITLALPIDCGCQFNITPYVGYVDSNQGGPTHPRAVGNHTTTPGGISPGDQFFGGVSIGWKF